jgi:hypothetical protein
MGVESSYREGAWKMMRMVPMIQAMVKIQRKRRSRTIATYFQSSITCNGKTDQLRYNHTTITSRELTSLEDSVAIMNEITYYYYGRTMNYIFLTPIEIT